MTKLDKWIAITGMVMMIGSGVALPPAQAADENPEAPTQRSTVTTLDNQIQDLKKEVLDLNRDLFLLEEDLLFPANTQFTVFVSMDIGMTFGLDAVQLRLDNQVVAPPLSC